MIAIRRATKADIPAVQKLSRALFDDPTSASDKYSDHNWPLTESGRKAFESGLEPGGFLAVAESGGRVVGYLSGEVAHQLDWRPAKRTELMSLYVEPEFREHGTGHKLVQAFLDWSRAQHAAVATVSAYADNGRGIDFYKQMGFTPESLILEQDL